MKAICREFLSIAFSYGFSTEEIVREIKALQGGKS
jgi:hypothetical protein